MILSDADSVPLADLPDPSERFEDFVELQIHMAEMHPKQS